MCDHSYDRRYNYSTGYSSLYTDDLAEVVVAAANHGGLRYCWSGYADRIYHDSTATQIGGTEIIRRSDHEVDVGTVLPPFPVAEVTA
jgi:hypothetical protein